MKKTVTAKLIETAHCPNESNPDNNKNLQKLQKAFNWAIVTTPYTMAHR